MVLGGVTEPFKGEAGIPPSSRRRVGCLALGNAGLPLLLLKLIELGYFKSQAVGQAVLLSVPTFEEHVGIEVIALAVLRLAIGEAGETTESPPVRRTRVGPIPLGECLGYEGGKTGRVHTIVLEPCLKIAGAGFHHRARPVAIRREPVHRIPVEIAEHGVPMLSRWPDIDVRAFRVVGLEERKTRNHVRRGQIRQAGEHSALRTPMS